MNINDVLIEEQYKSKITIIPVDTIDEVLKHALVPENMDGFLSKLKKMAVRSTSAFAEAPVINTTTA
jgi:Lon-like ATP-dependent protease